MPLYSRLSSVSPVTIIGLALILGLAPAARAQQTWTLLTADLSGGPIVLKSIDAGGVHGVTPGSPDEKVIPFGQFVELTRDLPPGQASGTFDLYLTTGDRVNGEPVSIKGETVTWKNPVAGEVKIPFRRLQSLSRRGVKPSDERRKEDLVTMSNKDTVHGTIADLSASQVTLQTDAGLQPIPLTGIESVQFAAVPSTGKERTGVRIRLDEGSSVIGEAATVSGAMLSLDVGGGATRSIDLARVVGIEQVNGPVSWLSSRSPSQSIYLPYLGTDTRRFANRMNRNCEGGPIFFKERRYERGIGVHSYSKVVFSLDGQTYTAFRTRYAIDTSGNDTDKANVTVRVLLDDKVVHEQANVTAGTLSPSVVLDLGAAKSLTLEVDFGANIDSQDRLNWIEPALLKTKPAGDPLPTPPVSPTTQPAAPSTQRAAPASRPTAVGAIQLGVFRDSRSDNQP